MNVETELARIVTDLADGKRLMPGDCITGKVTDQLTSEFLKAIKATGREDKLRWLALRAGVCALVNAELAARRTRLKQRAEGPRESIKFKPVATSKSYAAVVEEAKLVVEAREKAAEERANARAVEIMSRWTVGNKLLRDLTGAELERQAGAEAGKAAAHKRNSQFYQRLADMCPQMHKLGDAVSATEFLATFDAFFAGLDDRELSVELEDA